MNWYDIDGMQVINSEEQGLFASVMATSEQDARGQFFKRFPYGKIESIRKIENEVSLMPRFYPERDNCDAFYIYDSEAKKWNMSEKAVTLYFKHYDDARQVANALNKEWQRFLHNPE